MSQIAVSLTWMGLGFLTVSFAHDPRSASSKFIVRALRELNCCIRSINFIFAAWQITLRGI